MVHISATSSSTTAIGRIVCAQLAGCNLPTHLHTLLHTLIMDDLQYYTVGHPWYHFLDAAATILLDRTSPDDVCDRAVLTHFQAAWIVMNAAIGHLDHLQDNDPLPACLAALAPPLQYHVVFTYYVFAAGLISTLPHHVPCERTMALQHLWNSTMLRVAGGQQQDLDRRGYFESMTAVDAYQHMVHAKTGAVFALALGGLALLTGNNAPTCAALRAVGDLVGGLIQYHDDVADVRNQAAAATFAELGLLVRVDAPDSGIAVLWHATVDHYCAAMQHVLMLQAPQLEQPFMQLICTFFQVVQEAPGR